MRQCCKNIPVDIAPTVKLLPWNLNDTQTVAIKFKHKKEYKKCEYYENIRPLYVRKGSTLFDAKQ